MDGESRVTYYVKAFEKLDEGGKCTWNWAAFLFAPAWMIYRKMYLYGVSYIFVGAILDALITVCYLLISSTNASNGILTCLSFIVYLSIQVFFGYFGNSLYYSIVKNRIRKGYHKLQHFCPTSVTALWICFGAFFAIFFVMSADWLQKKQEHIDEKIQDFQDKMPTRENIKMYLDPCKPRSNIMYIAICSTVVLLVTLILILFKH